MNVIPWITVYVPIRGMNGEVGAYQLNVWRTLKNIDVMLYEMFQPNSRDTPLIFVIKETVYFHEKFMLDLLNCQSLDNRIGAHVFSKIKKRLIPNPIMMSLMSTGYIPSKVYTAKVDSVMHQELFLYYFRQNQLLTSEDRWSEQHGRINR